MVKFKRENVILIGTVTTAEEAVEYEKRGMDIIVTKEVRQGASRKLPVGGGRTWWLAVTYFKDC